MPSFIDTTAPLVKTVKPGNGKRASASTSIPAIFDEAIDPATLSKSTVKLVRNGSSKPVPVAVGYAPATEKLTLIPRQKLLSGATYTVTLEGGANGIKDLAGNALAVSKIWQFSVK